MSMDKVNNYTRMLATIRKNEKIHKTTRKLAGL
jgi:hypothetical protein